MSTYAVLFVSAFGAATVLPLPSEVPFTYVVVQDGHPLLAVVVATAGNYLGACTTYLLTRFAAGRFAPAGTGRWTHAAALMRRFGAPALLLSWVPLVGDAIVALAGAARMPFGRFSLFTVIGKAARYAALAWLLSR